MLGMVAVHDTLARAVVPMEPADGRTLTMYSCGPTVYRYAHIGNLRTFLMADLVRRAFEYQGIEVHHVQNITDVGHMTDELTDSGRDRMELAVQDEGRTAQEIADFYTQAFLDDTEKFNIRRAASYPKASEYIPQMKGSAYDDVSIRQLLTMTPGVRSRYRPTCSPPWSSS